MTTPAGSTTWTSFASPQWARCVIESTVTGERRYHDRAVIAWRLLDRDPQYLDHAGIIWSTLAEPKDARTTSVFTLLRFFAPGEPMARDGGHVDA